MSSPSEKHGRGAKAAARGIARRFKPRSHQAHVPIPALEIENGRQLTLYASAASGSTPFPTSTPTHCSMEPGQFSAILPCHPAFPPIALIWPQACHRRRRHRRRRHCHRQPLVRGNRAAFLKGQKSPGHVIDGSCGKIGVLAVVADHPSSSVPGPASLPASRKRARSRLSRCNAAVLPPRSRPPGGTSAVKLQKFRPETVPQQSAFFIFSQSVSDHRRDRAPAPPPFDNVLSL